MHRVVELVVAVAGVVVMVEHTGGGMVDSYAKTMLWESCVGAELSGAWRDRVGQASAHCLSRPPEEGGKGGKSLQGADDFGAMMARQTLLKEAPTSKKKMLEAPALQGWGEEGWRTGLHDQASLGGHHHRYGRRKERSGVESERRHSSQGDDYADTFTWYSPSGRSPRSQRRLRFRKKRSPEIHHKPNRLFKGKLRDGFRFPGPAYDSGGPGHTQWWLGTDDLQGHGRTEEGLDDRFQRFLQDMVTHEKLARLQQSNISCVLRSLELVDEGGELRLEAMAEATRQAEVTEELKEDLLEVLDRCWEALRCQPLADSELMPPALQRALSFLRCTRSGRQRACLRQDVRTHLRRHLPDSATHLHSTVDRVLLATEHKLAPVDLNELLMT